MGVSTLDVNGVVSQVTGTSVGQGGSGPPMRARKSILIVDDSREIAGLLAVALEDEGYAPTIARSGAEALHLARRTPPDLITLDLAMPGESGWDVFNALQSDPATASIPVLAVSAHADQFEQSDFKNFAGVITKPFYLSEVVETVAAVLGEKPGE